MNRDEIKDLKIISFKVIIIIIMKNLYEKCLSYGNIVLQLRILKTVYNNILL